MALLLDQFLYFEMWWKLMQASLIVDKTHLHLLPSMNPDGFAAQDGPKRNNAHDVDLNRDFPDQVRHNSFSKICVTFKFSHHPLTNFQLLLVQAYL